MYVSYEGIAAIRLFLAAILGAVIGLERESLNKSAGFRTHTLVCLGSCLIMMTSIEMYQNVGYTNTADPGRIAAQVVSGIVFLGAGTIIRSGFGVKGLTTAASLWVVAGIGLAVGMGSYFTAIITTGIVFLVLVYMTKFENRLRLSHDKQKKLHLTVEDKPGQLGIVTSSLGELDVHIRNLEMSGMGSSNRLKLVITVIVPYNHDLEEIIEKVSKIKGVYQVSTGQ